MWNWISCRVQLIWSVRLVLRAISYSRHVLMPVSSMNFGHEWFCAFAWSCTVSKGCQWPGQAVLGGCLYIICQDDMLLKTLRLLIKRNCHPSFFFFFCTLTFHLGERANCGVALMQYFIFFSFFSPSLVIKALEQTEKQSWDEIFSTTHSLIYSHTHSLSHSHTHTRTVSGGWFILITKWFSYTRLCDDFTVYY